MLAAVEEQLERGERKLRDKESGKAKNLFQAAVQAVQAEGLEHDPRGCLMLATATGSLLQLDAEEARHAGWAQRGVALPRGAEASPLSAEDRYSGLQRAASALEKGHAAAAAADASADELSHLYDSRAQVATFMSEECEAELERGGVDAARAAAAAAALEQAASAVAWWGAAGKAHLASQAKEEWEAEPDVDLLCRLGSASVRHGKLLMQTSPAGAPPPAEATAAAEAAAERALKLYEEACARCDSAKGDAVDEVLRDWSQALWDSASLALLVGGGAASRASARELLSRAAGKVADSMGMLVVPLVSSCNLLGDVLTAAAEVERDEVAAAGGAAERAAARRACLELYARAAKEGYERGLRVSSRDLRAQLGCADAWLGIARVRRAVAAEQPAEGAEAGAAAGVAAEALGRARALYTALLQQPPDLWLSQGLAVHEYAEARYNACCTLALACAPAGAEADGAGLSAEAVQCGELLRSLLGQGDAKVEEVAADEDFAHLRGTSWWQQTLAAAPGVAAAAPVPVE